MLEFGEVRRPELESYARLLTAEPDPFDILTGMGDRVPRDVGMISRPSSWILHRTASLLRRAPVIFLAARDGSKVVGTTVVFFSRHSGVVSAVGTDRSYRRRGIASKLLGMAESRIRARRKPWAWIDVESENVIARDLYRARGYRAVGTATWYRWIHTVEPVARRRQAGPAQPITRGLEHRSMARWCRSVMPRSIADAFCPTPRTLTPLEFLAATHRSSSATWGLSHGGRVQACIRASFTYCDSPGFVFLPGLSEEVSSEALADLILLAVAWLQHRGSRDFVLPVQDYLDCAVPSLLSLGFKPVLETTSMLLRL